MQSCSRCSEGYVTRLGGQHTAVIGPARWPILKTVRCRRGDFIPYGPCTTCRKVRGGRRHDCSVAAAAAASIRKVVILDGGRTRTRTSPTWSSPRS